VEKTNDGKDEVVFHAGNVHRFAGIAITCIVAFGLEEWKRNCAKSPNR